MSKAKQWRVMFNDLDHPSFIIEAAFYAVNNNGDLSFYRQEFAESVDFVGVKVPMPPNLITSFASGIWGSVVPLEDYT